ncbi:MAG TPA: VTT domain-containing protein [Casimicrobiaceae bacterium]|nr:VTT domain-containing protein [Casimicrobiaceae bacterium]
MLYLIPAALAIPPLYDDRPSAGGTPRLARNIAHDPPILEAGRTCWRIDRAHQLAFLVDGAEYFRAVREALLRARRSIFILGWDIDSRMLLVPDGARDGYPEPLGEFLNALVAERAALRAYVLTWDFAMLYALEREWLPVYKLDWKTHRRLSFRLDGAHPVGASHHQKVIVIDDAVAFVSGFDLTRNRWDTSQHACPNALRCDTAGTPYGPFHDIGVVVSGPCASSLGALARTRWLHATDTPASARTQTRYDPWPASAQPVLFDVDVGISRTQPPFGPAPRVDEVRQLHLRAIAAARHDIFAENQYFTSRAIADAFAARLAERDTPDIAVVSPLMQSGWLEMSTMGVLRARIHRDLRAADRDDRYRLYCPHLPWLERSSGCLNVHSKVLCIDDAFLTLGSANLSDRSMGLDTECNLSLEARGDPRIAAAIARLRHRLLAEHLDCTPEDVARAQLERGRLHAAIDALRRPGARSLDPFDPVLDPAVDVVTPDHRVLDPEKPLDPDLIVEDLVPEHRERKGIRARLGALVMLVIGLVAIALAWRYTALRDWLNFDRLVDFGESVQSSPLAPVAVLVGYVAAGLLVIPLTLLIAVTAFVFGPVSAVVYSLAGATLSAAVTYAIGRKLGREAVRKVAGRRLNELSRRLARRGLLAVLLVRVLPVAPFSVINVVAGASHIGWRDFLLGTVLGLLPGTVLTSVFVDRIVDAARHPGPATFALLLGVAVLIGIVAWVSQRWLRRREPPQQPTPDLHVG